jgi:hypothetical protein
VVGDRHVTSGSGQLLVLMRTLPAVVKATPTRFTLQLRIQIEQSSVAIANLPQLLETLQWHVVWMGIES